MAGKLLDGDGIISIRDWVNGNIKVTPNPTIPSGTTTTTLTSIKIGNNYYTVPSGGGGGSGYLPLSAGVSNPLTGDLYLGAFSQQGYDNKSNKLILGANSGDPLVCKYEEVIGASTYKGMYFESDGNYRFYGDSGDVTLFNDVSSSYRIDFPNKTGNQTFAMLSDAKKVYWHTISITEGSYDASFSFQSTSATPLDSIDALNTYFNTFKFVSGSYYEPGSTQFAVPNAYLLSSVNKATGNNAGKFEVAFKSGLNTFAQSHFFSSAATVSDVVEEA